MFFADFQIGQLFQWELMDCVYLGAAMMISSTTIITKTLTDLGKTREKFAEVIFGILIAEDIIAILMIASLSTFAAEGGLRLESALGLLGRLAIFMVAASVAGLLVVPRLLRFVARFRHDETLLVAVLGLCFGFALLAAELNFSVGLGAFIIGAIIAESDEIRKIERLAALLLSLPIVIATLRKLQAFGMMIGEVTISRPSERQRVVLRTLVANTVLFTGSIMLALMMRLLSSVLLPPGKVLLVLVGIAIILALALKTTFVRLYSRAQGVIQEILSREESAHAVEHRDELPSLLHEAQLLTLRVAPEMTAAGRNIGELRLRTESGASIVVVRHGEETTTNPGPEVTLHPGDEILLLGTPSQLRNARAVLETRADP